MSIVIAIDGPSAGGKGTLAKRLAAHLNYAWLETGLLYRWVAHEFCKTNGPPFMAIAIAEQLAADFNLAMLDDPILKSDEIAQAASTLSVIQGVRAALLDLQRNFAKNPPAGKQGVILDGRDIGTVVCPDADIKFFVTADVETRAARRAKELQSAGLSTSTEAVLSDMRVRDARDMGRAAAPLKMAADAIEIDTSRLSIDEMLQAALKIIHEKVNAA